MFLPIRLCLWLISRLRLMLFSFVVGVAVGLLVLVREEQRTWGVRPIDAERELPGDEIIPVADIVDTRSLRIDAAPERVWPWLVQMGYGRGGWYSYDRLDMDRPSADTILEDYQDLAEGDLVPTHPGGGFVARAVDPGRALVLYLDSELAERQAEAAADEAEEAAEAAEATPAGLQAAGVMGGVAMPDFRATWSFVLEPEPGGATRLVERLRVWTGDGGPAQRLGMPAVGVGVFLMTRRHMLGLKERAERLATRDADDTPSPEQAPA